MPKAAIVGVGTSRFARRIEDKSLLDLRLDAVLAAVEDAGLSRGDIDGLIIGEGSESFSERYHMEFAEILGLYDTPLCVTAPMGGCAPGYGVEVARWAVESGRCRNVLVVQGRKESDAHNERQSYTDLQSSLNMHYPDFELVYGPLMPSFYAVVAQRHMAEYGTTEEQLAGVAVAARYNASLNPDAILRQPLSVEEVLSAEPISTPFRKPHCCLINDGAAAMVIGRADQDGLAKSPVRILGGGGGQAGYFTGFIAGGGADKGYSLTRTIAKKAAQSAFREAGVTPADIDLMTTSDSFAIQPLVMLEDYGFCEKGEGGAFVGTGESIMVGGRLPVNPHGGALACTHAPTNFMNYIESVRQLRGECGERQIEGARLALAAAGAGIVSTHYVSVLAAA